MAHKFTVGDKTVNEAVETLRDELANLLEMYASDQMAMANRHAFAKQRTAAKIRAEVYAELATEIRAIEVE